jgi:hypothetical protein
VTPPRAPFRSRLTSTDRHARATRSARRRMRTARATAKRRRRPTSRPPAACSAASSIRRAAPLRRGARWRATRVRACGRSPSCSTVWSRGRGASSVPSPSARRGGGLTTTAIAVDVCIFDSSKGTSVSGTSAPALGSPEATLPIVLGHPCSASCAGCDRSTASRAADALRRRRCRRPAAGWWGFCNTAG